MERAKAQTLFLIVAIGLTVLRIVQSAPLGLGLGGLGGPGGFGLPQPSLPRQQLLQTSGQSTVVKYTYLLEEENAGYFRGEWYAAGTMGDN